MKFIDPHAHLSDEELGIELMRRLESVHNGTAELIPSEEVHARLRK